MVRERYDMEREREDWEEREEREERLDVDSENGRFRAEFNERVNKYAQQEFDGTATAIMAAQELFSAGNPCLMLAETCMTLAKLKEDETPTEELKKTREQAARYLVEIEAGRDDEK